MRSRRLCLVFLLLGAMLSGAFWPARVGGQTGGLPSISLVSTFTGFSSPVSITHAGDGSNRLFVVEQNGRIRVIRNGAPLATPFLDISARISAGGERGLLGLAFPPGFNSKQYFYVNYTNAARGDTVISRFRVSATNPDVADPSSEQIIFTTEQPFANHNGGQLAFSPRDGFLYIGLGDGGSGGDPFNLAQSPSSPLGKMLRIDTETGSPATYTVPATNPFVGHTGFRPEIWALGLRNPWRFSFDRQTADLYIADVGQNAFEEVNFQAALSAGGENYGWRVMEGFHCFNPSSGCVTTGLTLPVVEYGRNLGVSVTGGFVYRGGTFPRMQGLYFYGDFGSGRIWGLRQQGSVWQNTELLDSTINISTFGEDEAGNLYVADYTTGTIFRITDTVTAPASTIQFSAGSYQMPEAGGATANITLTRSGDLSTAASVDLTANVPPFSLCNQKTGVASPRCDYATVGGTVRFAAGQQSRTVTIPVVDDRYAEGNETFTLTLSNATGGGVGLGSPANATVTITDNDAADTTSPIFDVPFFVRQHYLDFLSREPDPVGFAGWQQTINGCPNGGFGLDNPQCDRVLVSAAFFQSLEFQTRGYFAYRFYEVAFDRRPTYAEFVPDIVKVGGPQSPQEETQSKNEFTDAFVLRPEFTQKFNQPQFQSPQAYVDELERAAGVTIPNKAFLVGELSAGRMTRAQVLRAVAESREVEQRFFNEAFVAMQYFGYLRRDPDQLGFQGWLNTLNTTGDFRRMIFGFIYSDEYIQRFGLK